MPKNRNGGLRKRCGCPRRNWAKCPHGWHFNFKWRDVHYRLSLDRETGTAITSKSDAQAVADQIRIDIRAGRFRTMTPGSAATLDQLALLCHLRSGAFRRKLSSIESSRRLWTT